MWRMRSAGTPMVGRMSRISTSAFIALQRDGRGQGYAAALTPHS